MFSVKSSGLLLLGLLTAVKLKIIPYKPYIKITYTPTYTTDEAMKVLEHETMKGNKIYKKYKYKKSFFYSTGNDGV